MQDSKQIDELFRLMDDVCENGDAALPALEQYLQTQTDAPEIDTEASLKKFKADHKEFFVKPHRGRRLCYRIFVVAAAVFAAGTVFALATGHNPFDYAAMWGAETFGFYHDDFATSEDGKIIYYPDGSWEDRSNMPDYDHETYTALPENNTSSSENSPEMLEPIDKGEALPEYANLPDTTSSDIGLKKGTSAWDGSHTIEWFDVENVSLKETLTALQINHPIAPSWLPDGYKQTRIQVTNDHMIGAYDVRADYAKDADDSKMFIQISKITDITGDTIEKDDRAVIEYTKEKTTWYIMHNLQRLNAAALMDDYQVLISAPISVDEMKKIIDSIYE